MSRPSVPASLKRRLFEEAGYRCAIPTCRATSALQMEHIEDWAKVQKHEFENMIVLCANCHARVTTGEIRKDAVRAYKRNLAIINGRYSLYEYRLMEAFYTKMREHPGEPLQAQVAENDYLHIKGMVDDDLLVLRRNPGGMWSFGLPISPMQALLTEAGKKLINSFFNGRDIEN
ncbi:HNH endonuclease [Rhodovulum sulfidophilum]|uniref:HNH endonuclease n=1 Tax=Rhodovulum sulfidophilum TaxID=35806 RepID=UPI0009D6A258|nr:HNH endonuclease signature motif containing protein [Rhodovulum sulfidophilum]